jgi:hypothetical protein
MPLQSWQATLVVAQLDGTALTNSATETSIIPAQAKFTLPANFLDAAGKRLRIKASGRISNAASATMTFRVKFGSTAVAASQAIALNATAKTNVTFDLEWGLVLRAIGATANLMHTAVFSSEAVIGVGTNTYAGSQSIPASAPAVGSNFDSTAAQQIDLTSQWGAASASNSIQVHMYQVESLN